MVALRRHNLENFSRKRSVVLTDLFLCHDTNQSGPKSDQIYEQLFITNVHKVLIYFTLQNLEVGSKRPIFDLWF